MIKADDELRIIEKLPHRKIKEVIGKVVSVDKYKVNVIRLKNKKQTFNTSYNISDFKDKNKEFYILKEGVWVRIQIIITEFQR